MINKGHDCESPMNTRRILTHLIGLLLVLVVGSGVTWAAADDVLSNKDVVIDGHVVHDVGELGSHVTNWGLIGSMPSSSLPFSNSPSAQWPIWSGEEYL